MKRYLAAIMALLLLLVGCSQNNKPNETSEPEETQPPVVELDETAVSAVLAEWEKLIEVANLKGEIELWALDYIEQYCEDPTVANMQSALAAAEAAIASLQMIEMPDCSLDAATLSTLAAGGADMSFVPIEYNNMKDSLVTDIEVWQSILGSILTDSFWQYGIEYLDGWASVRRDSTELSCLFAAEMSNAVLLSFGMDENSDTYAKWTESAPVLLGGEYKWNSDQSALTEEMSATLDKLEEKIVESSTVTSVLSANYAMFSDANATGDWTAVYDVAVDFDDIFIPVPIPDWDDDGMQLYSYTYDEEAGKAWFTSAGDDLSVPRDGFVMQYEGVSYEEFFNYVNYLDAIGLKYYSGGSTISEDEVSLVYLDVCLMSLEWSEDIVSIHFYDNTSLLTPTWYIFYMAQK